MTGREIVERALLKKPVPRIPCFPLIDTAFASAYAGKPLRELELNPNIHARALSLCAERLPVDGFYVNICLSEKQAAGFDPARGILDLDRALEVKIPENDVMSVAKTGIGDLTDERLFEAELFTRGCAKQCGLYPKGSKKAAGLRRAFGDLHPGSLSRRGRTVHDGTHRQPGGGPGDARPPPRKS
jgi:hypothetical protein